MKVRLLFFSVFFSFIFSFSSLAGTLYNDGINTRCRDDDGTDIHGWYQDGENGPWYYFDEDGYAHHGWLSDGGKTYYLRTEDGTMRANQTMVISGGVWLFNGSGEATNLSSGYSGWLLDDIGWSYRLSDGSYVTNTQKQIKGENYCFDETGYMKTGLVEIDGHTYYFDEESGAMVHDAERTLNGVIYNFNSNGEGEAVWPYKAVTVDIPDSEKTEFRKTVDAMADSILSGLINNSMSRQQKAEKIYAWIRANFSYNGHSATRDWVEEAYQGLRKRHGDCYTYFAVSQELLVRAGIPSIEVIRYTDNDHYWNLVQMDDGSWYHFDATPRRAGGYFCLWTDAQMLNYSAQHNGCFAFDRSLYPSTP